MEYAFGITYSVEIDCWISLGLNVVSRFEKAGSNYNSTPCEHKKPRLDCIRNYKILYCPTSDCVKTFLFAKLGKYN